MVCVRSPLPAPFCIIAIFSSATKISYPLKPSREAWKLALLPTRRKISNATLAAGTEVLARVPTERKTNKQKKKTPFPEKGTDRELPSQCPEHSKRTTQSDPTAGRRAPHIGLPRKGHAKLDLEMEGGEEL